MTCATKCALCGEVLDQYLPYLGVERTMAAHAVGCPKRPIEVGDYVRWERTNREMWFEGEITAISADRGSIHIRVDRHGAKWLQPDHVGETLRCDGPKWTTVAIHRIPRPAEAQAMKAACRVAVVEDLARQGHVTAEQARSLLDQPQIEPAAPVLVDGLDVRYDGITLRILIAQDRCNSQEAGPPLFRFTPAQRAALSAHWSAALRAKVAAGREAERCRVTYCEVEPWE